MKQLVASLTIGLVALPALAQSSIEQVAPENAVVVFGIKDVDSAMNHLRNHPMMQMLSGAGAADDGEAEAAGGDGGWAELLPEPLPTLMRELGGGGKPVPTPSGSAGFAMFSAIDPEIGIPEPEFLVYADYGDQAEVFMTRVDELLQRTGEQLSLRFQKRDVDGVEVVSIQLPEPAPDPADQMDDPFGGQPMDPMSMMMPDAERFRVDTVHIVRSDRSILVGSDLVSVRRGVAALAGTNELGVAADNRALQGVMKQIGESNAYGAVLTRDLLQLVMGPDTMGMAMMFTPMARAMFGEIQGLGYGMSTGNAADPMTQRFTVYMPNGKQGVTALLDTPLPRAEPPAFVGSETVSFTAMNFDFSRVIPVIQGFLQSNPMMQAQFAEPWMNMRPQLEKTFAGLGSRTYIVQTAAGDLKPGELGSLMAVECTKPEEFKASFTEFASQIGMQSREIAGHTMFVPAPADPAAAGDPGLMGGMMGMPAPEMSFGLGHGYVFVGSEPEVTAALEAKPRAGQTALSQSIAYRRSTAMLPDGPLVAWGFSDVARIAESAAEMGDGQQMPAGFPIDPQMIGQLVGPSVWYMKSTPDGFVGIAHQLPAPQAVHVETEDD